MLNNTTKKVLTSIVTCVLIIAAAFPVGSQIHLYNPVVKPGLGITGKDVFTITVDYDGIPISNFYLETFNDEYADLAVQLTNHPANDTTPCWSPCERISFVSNRIDWNNSIIDPQGWRHRDIWTMDPDGSNKTYVTNSDWRDGYDVSWSPDCSQIVFCRTDNSWVSRDDDICLVNVATGESSVQFIYEDSDDQCPDWSPDGTKVAFTGAGGIWQIFTIDTAGAGITQVTNFPNDCQWPDWSPDGTKIAFEHFATPSSIWVVNSNAVMADPTSATMLTDNGRLPAWSPDGSKIAFCRETSGNWDIYVMNADGTGIPLQITKDPAEDLHPTWSPDGTTIAFQSDRSGNWDIWVISVTHNDLHPRLAVDSDGDVHKVWMREVNSGHYETWYAELNGPGPNFKVSPKQISDVNAYDSVYPSIALDLSNASHVVWIDFRNNNIAEIYYSKIEDDIGTDLTNQEWPWEDEPISLIDGMHSGRAVGFPPVGGDMIDSRIAAYIEHPDIDVGPFDRVHIVWSDARNSGIWEVYYQQQNTSPRPDPNNPNEVFFNDIPISDLDSTSSMCPVIAASMVGSPGPAIHIAWQDMRDGCWEIYYEQREIDCCGLNVDDRLVSHAPSSREPWCSGCPLPFNPGVNNSASPDIGVDAYVHITWMDQRDGWCGDAPSVSPTSPNPGIWVPHKQHLDSSYYWEIYKVMLKSNGDFFCGQGGCIKRQSDMASWRGRGRYTGPVTDGDSMYPRIAVNPIFTSLACTHLTWHDDRDLNWEIYYTELQSYCENPTSDKSVTINVSSDMYPDIVLDPASNYKRAHLKWQTDRQGFYRIYETRRKGKEDPGADYIIAELYRDESPNDILIFNLHRVYPYQDTTIGPITYGFTFGLLSPGNYHFRVCARDNASHEYCTEWINGPKVVSEKQLLTGIHSTFNLHYDVVNQYKVVELYIRVVKEDYSNMIHGIEIFPELQQPEWDSVVGIVAPEGWNYQKIGNGVRFYTETNPLLTCQRVKFTFRITARRISWYMRVHVIDQDHQNIGTILSTKWRLYYYYLM